MPVVAISARALGKEYTLGAARPRDMLREAIVRGAGSVTARMLRRQPPRPARERFWALRDVSFEVEAGHAVGIVGANGAGKSTLLKLLARITEPSEGTAVMRGRVGSLLEVGTGFHPELTGRENIFLNGAILGMRRSEITRRFGDIVEFAEVQRFLDTPVKHYSDGMYLRLAFAVAAHLEPEILIVDEVLAVGDARFQRRCLGKMQDLASGEGRTVLFVSHNMSIVQRLCRSSLLLEAGRLVEYGPTDAVLARYLGAQRSVAPPDEWIELTSMRRSGSAEVRFTAARYRSGNASVADQPYPDGPLEFHLKLESAESRVVPSLAVVLSDRHGTKLVSADILSAGRELRLAGGETIVRLTIDRLHLNPGVYDVALWVGEMVGTGFDLIEPAFQLEVVSLESSGFGSSAGAGPVTCRCDFSVL